MGTGATSAAHLDLDGDGQVDTRIQLLYFSEVGRMGSHGKLFSSNKPGFSISITPINPSSNGQLLFDGDAVHIEPNYLKDQLDIDHLKKALDYVVKILEMDSFRNIIKEIYNSEQIKNNPIDYIKNNTYSGYHLIGGCGSIVNTDFQVKGFEGLFICDASILMEYVSSNIHSTIVILADLFAGKFTKKFSFK
jgi:choline dehydrogenase-like flavoprotein